MINRMLSGLLGLVVLGGLVVTPLVSQAQSVVELCPPGEICDSVAFQDGSGRFHFWDRIGPPDSVASFFYGNPGDVAFSGDWDCDGDDSPGLYRRSDGYVYLRDSNTQGIADITFFFGNPGDYPIAGDFNGNGCDTVSIYRPSEARFYVINTLGSSDGGLGAADFSFLFGNFGDKPFVGDFNGNGIDSIGLHRESTGLVYFRNSLTTGIADSQFIYGNPGDILVAGDWDGDGDDTVAVYRPSNGMFYVKLNNTQGNADYTYNAGSGFIGVVTAPRLIPALCDAQTAIPKSECEALESLYKATGGSGWLSNAGWLRNLSVCSWKGVSCTSGHVTSLDLSFNRLLGTIPAGLGNLTNLKYLDLSSNTYPGLSGPIPPDLGDLANLESLNLGVNRLSGPIPLELANLANLQTLNLEANILSGSIPPEFADLANLQTLNLEANILSGSIPAQLGNLTNLRNLFLSSNGLSGSIPTEFGSLTNLDTVWLHANRLSGVVPESLLSIPASAVVSLYGQTGCLTAVSPELQARLFAWDPGWNNGCTP